MHIHTHTHTFPSLVPFQLQPIPSLIQTGFLLLSCLSLGVIQWVSLRLFTGLWV